MNVAVLVGMFAVEEPYISTAMGNDKVKRHMDTGAEFITGSDSSCLMHNAGCSRKEPLSYQSSCM